MSLLSKSVTFHKFTHFLLRKLVRFQSGNGLYKFDGNSIVHAAEKDWSLITLYSRDTYTEFLKRYPISDNDALRQVVQEEYRESANYYFLMQQGHAEQKTVVIYHMKQLASSGLLSFCVPQSHVLGQALAEKQVACVQSFNTTYFLTKLDGMAISRLQNQFCPDINHFRWSLGIPDDSEPIYMSDVDLADKWFRLLLESLPSLPSFFHWDLSSFRVLPWKSWAALIALLSASYLMLSSAFLGYSVYQLEQQQPVNSDDLTLAMRYQQTIKSRLDKNDQLTSFINKQHSTLVVWVVLHELTQVEGCIVRSMQLQDSRLVISGVAPRATDVIERLRARSDLSAVKFDSPVSRQDTVESFVISASLQIKGSQPELNSPNSGATDEN